MGGRQHGIDRGDGARGKRATHLLTLAVKGLVWLACLCQAAAAPPPLGCEPWAASNECLRNPTFTWAACAAACIKGRGLEEPWAKLDAQALAGPPSNASVLELSFADSSGFKPLRIVLRPDLSPQASGPHPGH